MALKRLIAKGLRAVLQPPALTNCRLEKDTAVCSGTQMNGCTMARCSYVGHDCFLLSADIGPFCSIADNCRVGGAHHPIERVSSSPVFHAGKNVMKKHFAAFDAPVSERISVGADVWIGAGATVKSGLKIGIGAVIGAGSVVTHDVPPYEIWAGNPARCIRKRFDDEVIEGLLATRWWELSEEELIRFAPYFDDPARFLAAWAKEKEANQ